MNIIPDVSSPVGTLLGPVDSRTVGTKTGTTPSWVNHETEAREDRGPDVHPEDAAVDYTRDIDDWERIPQCRWIAPERVGLYLQALRRDNIPNETADTVVIWNGSGPFGTGSPDLREPQLTLVAQDAHRLGVTLLGAAAMLSGDVWHAGTPWRAVNGGLYRMKTNGRLESYQSHEDEWRPRADFRATDEEV